MNEPTRYVKRLRLRAELTTVPITSPVGPVTFTAFSPSHLADHARVLWAAFRDGPETVTFPSLGTETGCRDLMHALVSLPGFRPEATWLAALGPEPIGTIQSTTTGAEAEIHNLGVVSAHRHRGVGAGLLTRCLAALAEAGCRRVTLDVTASNEPALALYRKFGFRPYKTVYLRAYGTVPSLGQGI